MPNAVTRASWQFAVGAGLIAILLLWPAWLNGQPILFPDSIGYERAGAVSLHAAGIVADKRAAAADAAPAAAAAPGAEHGRNGITTARSPFYGVPIAMLIALGGTWLAVAAQALIVAVALLLALHRLGVQRAAALATLAALAAVSGLAVFSVALMPDVFLGLMILGFALVLATPGLPRRELWLWLVLITGAMLFHRAFLAVGMLMTVAALLLESRFGFRRVSLIVLAGCCLIGAAGHFVVEVAVKLYSGKESVGVPFLLARYGESPVLIDYLAENCDPPRFALCRYRARLPLAPDEFLWGAHNIYSSAPELDRRAIAAEQNEVLHGAFAARPVAATLEAMRGSAQQFFTVGMDDFAIGIPASTAIDALMTPSMRDYPASRIAMHSFPFGPMARLALAAYLAGFAGLIVALWRSVPARPSKAAPDVVAVAALVITGVALNAIVSGTLSGVFDRYQGRIAWLIPFVAVVALAARRQRVTVSA